MSDKTTDTDDEDKNKEEDTDEGKGEDEGGSLSKEHEALLERLVSDRIKNMKGNVDKAYKQLEALTKENVRLKEAQTAADRKKLESEGKQAEADKLRIAELEEKLTISESKIVGYTRDREVEKAISSLSFRNDYAKDVALRDIIEDLVQDDDGAWVHKSGASLTDYVKAFAKDPNKDFLFKPKENNGTGTTTPKGPAGGKPKNFLEMTTAEQIAAAAAGKLGPAFAPM